MIVYIHVQGITLLASWLDPDAIIKKITLKHATIKTKFSPKKN